MWNTDRKYWKQSGSLSSSLKWRTFELIWLNFDKLSFVTYWQPLHRLHPIILPCWNFIDFYSFNSFTSLNAAVFFYIHILYFSIYSVLIIWFLSSNLLLSHFFHSCTHFEPHILIIHYLSSNLYIYLCSSYEFSYHFVPLISAYSYIWHFVDFFSYIQYFF